MNKRKRKSIIMYALLLLVGLFAAFFISAFMYAVLQKVDITAAIFSPLAVIASLKANKEHFVILASLSFLIVMCVVCLFFSSSDKEHYTSEMDRITDEIETPKSVGQGQHGSAKWLVKSKYDKIFGVYSFSVKRRKVSDPLIKALMEAGKTDQRVIQKNISSQKKKKSQEKEGEGGNA